MIYLKTGELPGVALGNISTKSVFTGNGNTFIYSEISSYAYFPSPNTAYEQSTEAINVIPTPGTGPGTGPGFQVSAKVS